jgi:hypothetical protein
MDRHKRNQRSRAILPVVSLALVVAGLSVSLSGVAGAAGGDSFAQLASPTSILQFPTATQTVVGGPTATSSRTPTLTPVLAEALGDPTNLRSGPSLDFDIVGELSAGTSVPVIGRSVRFPWLLVIWQDAPGGQAWVYEQLVRVIGDITTVPIVEEPQLPTVDPTQAAIQATATILLQTPGAAETATATAFFAPTGVYTQTPGGPVGPGVGGPQPTFTPPDPLQQVMTLAPPETTPERRGPAPAALIISLGLMGVLTLGMGLLRRL